LAWFRLTLPVIIPEPNYLATTSLHLIKMSTDVIRAAIPLPKVSQQKVDERFNLIQYQTNLESFSSNVKDGLSAASKQLSPAFLYDERGSNLFEDICKLDEYYLTRSEAEILESKSAAIVEPFDKETVVVELGSGSSIKTRLLIDAYTRRHNGMHYVPIDISSTMLKESSQEMLKSFDKLKVTGIAAEYREALRHLAASREFRDKRKLVLWLGSSIGNFNRAQALQFMTEIRTLLKPGDCFLLGVDLKKDENILVPAYHDSKGVTEDFIKNVLRRINNELGGDFDLNQFTYSAIYNQIEGAIEMRLISNQEQSVNISSLNMSANFKEKEAIFVESSYKYNQEDIETLVNSSGFTLTQQWFDSSNRFSLNLLTVPDQKPTNPLQYL
jgi:dimethylhistidine N-methyltransferase